MTTYGIDWDDTLVDVETQEWLPDALERLRQLAHSDDVFIHTCRANWPEGRAQVEAQLASVGLNLRVEPKPLADVYIDDRAQTPDWATPIRSPRHVNRRQAAPRKLGGVYVY